MKIHPPPDSQTSRSTHLTSIVLLSAVGILAGFGTLHSPFLYDDAHAIVENPHIEKLTDFQKTVGLGNIFNRSVLLLTFAINREVGAGEVFGFHLINLWLHLGVALCIYFLVIKLVALEPATPRAALRPLPFLAAAIHLLHPMTVETVTYLSARSSLLATLFFVLGMLFFVRAAFPGPEEKAAWKQPAAIAAALLCFLLGTGTKEIIVTLPVLGCALLWIHTPSAARNRLLPRLIWIAAPVAIYLIYRLWHTGSLWTLRADPLSSTLDRGLYLLTQVHVLVSYYLLKLLLPFNLNFEPDVRLLVHWADPRWLAAAGCIAVIAVTALRQNSLLIRFALLWALLTVLPTSSLIPLKQIATEHRTYLPGVGICLLLGMGLLNLTPLRPAVRWGTFFLLAIFSTLTLQRILDFRTEVTLWQDTAAKSPRKALVHNNLAAAHLLGNQLEKAESALARTIELDPGHTDAYINLGHLLTRRERWQEALQQFDKALLLGSSKTEAFYNAGRVRNHLGMETEAVPLLEQAVTRKPNRPEYHFHLGNAYRKLNRLDEALKSYRHAIRLNPAHVQAHNNTGLIFWQLKNFPLAEQAFLQALALGPGLPKVRNNLAALYLAQNRFDAALPHLERLVGLQPENAKARKLLEVAQTLKGSTP